MSFLGFNAFHREGILDLKNKQKDSWSLIYWFYRCEKLKKCVECTIFGTGIRDRSQCQRECIAYDIKSTKDAIIKNDEEEKICREVDHDKCEIIYKYMYDELQKLTVLVQKKRNCPPNIFGECSKYFMNSFGNRFFIFFYSMDNSCCWSCSFGWTSNDIDMEIGHCVARQEGVRKIHERTEKFQMAQWWKSFV